MKLTDMKSLFVYELKDLLDAEQRITKALPKMAKAAENNELRSAFESHLRESQGHVTRLENILKNLGDTAKGTRCLAMEGLINEGEDLLKHDGKPNEGVLDAALIAMAQRVEHYEIAAYGAARTFARSLGYDDAAKLLQTTLDEEHAANQGLTQLAESQVNKTAVAS